ncbi:MAG: hypothetical protein IJY23_05785 [Clostridia bacterium]|nr:hypothetical protein [Clostridia bacterium]
MQNYTLCDITVAPGKAYSQNQNDDKYACASVIKFQKCFKPTAHGMNSLNARHCLAPNGSSLKTVGLGYYFPLKRLYLK